MGCQPSAPLTCHVFIFYRIPEAGRRLWDGGKIGDVHPKIGDVHPKICDVHPKIGDVHPKIGDFNRESGTFGNRFAQTQMMEKMRFVLAPSAFLTKQF